MLGVRIIRKLGRSILEHPRAVQVVLRLISGQWLPEYRWLPHDLSTPRISGGGVSGPLSCLSPHNIALRKMLCSPILNDTRQDIREIMRRSIIERHSQRSCVTMLRSHPRTRSRRRATYGGSAAIACSAATAQWRPTLSACSVASRRTLWSPTRPTALITT